MDPTLYMVACFIPDRWNDGRDTEYLWGLEHQYHATRAAAELARDRLRAGVAGRRERPAYEVVERHRDDYSADEIGAKEWRAACKQAGLDPGPGHHPIRDRLAAWRPRTRG
jgi:hypothetical protein